MNGPLSSSAGGAENGYFDGPRSPSQPIQVTSSGMQSDRRIRAGHDCYFNGPFPGCWRTRDDIHPLKRPQQHSVLNMARQTLPAETYLLSLAGADNTVLLRGYRRQPKERVIHPPGYASKRVAVQPSCGWHCLGVEQQRVGWRGLVLGAGEDCSRVSRPLARAAAHTRGVGTASQGQVGAQLRDEGGPLDLRTTRHDGRRRQKVGASQDRLASCRRDDPRAPDRGRAASGRAAFIVD